MKKKVVTAFMMAALGSSLVFTQAVMAADTTAKTETSENADKDSTESKDKDVAEACIKLPGFIFGMSRTLLMPCKIQSYPAMKIYRD